MVTDAVDPSCADPAAMDGRAIGAFDHFDAQTGEATGHDGKAIRTMLKANAVPHQEAFLVGAGVGHQVLGEAAGLPFTKDIDTWLAPAG